MKNKIISILCIFILISFCFINNIVFATESGSNLILDTMINFIKTDIEICPTNTGYVAYILTKADGFNYWTNNGRNAFGAAVNGGDVRFNSKHFNFDTYGNITDTGVLTGVSFIHVNTTNIFYSTFDMYGDKACTEIFFYRYTEPTVSYLLLEPLKTALVASITPAQTVTVLAAVISAGMTFVLMWFGVRKLIKIFKKALINGKISF